eukprot:2961997-Rhodomonas_salina.1
MPVPVMLCSTSIEIGGRSLNWPNCCPSLRTAKDLAEKGCVVCHSGQHSAESESGCQCADRPLRLMFHPGFVVRCRAFWA